MVLQQIPLTPGVNQTFQIALLIAGKNVPVEIDIRYSEMGNCFNMSISDTQGNLLLSNVPLVTGGPNSNNILKAHGHLGLGKAYVVNISNTTEMSYPNANTLGESFVLVWSDT